MQTSCMLYRVDVYAQLSRQTLAVSLCYMLKSVTTVPIAT